MMQSLHYPAYYTATWQNKKKLHTVCLFTINVLPFAVLISREIIWQRRWRRLATEYAGGDKYRTSCGVIWDVIRQIIHSPWQRSRWGCTNRGLYQDWGVYMIIYYSDWAALPLLIRSEVCMSTRLMRVALYLDLLYFIKDEVELHKTTTCSSSQSHGSSFHIKSPSHVFSDI